eukprot:sb/3474294/
MKIQVASWSTAVKLSLYWVCGLFGGGRERIIGGLGARTRLQFSISRALGERELALERDPGIGKSCQSIGLTLFSFLRPRIVVRALACQGKSSWGLGICKLPTKHIKTLSISPIVESISKSYHLNCSSFCHICLEPRHDL